MSYKVKTVSSIASVQAVLDAYSDWELVGYSITKEGMHCLIFKR